MGKIRGDEKNVNKLFRLDSRMSVKSNEGDDTERGKEEGGDYKEEGNVAEEEERTKKGMKKNKD